MPFVSPHATPVTFVIVGAGHAGVELAFALRKEAAQARILLIDAEEALPYHRPPLSKQYLLSPEEMPPTLLRPAPAYSGHGIELRLGARVTGIDRQRRQLHIDGAEPIEYDRLILATGARARQLELPLPDGPLAPGVLHTLRTIDEARQLRHALHGRSSIAIVGAGYIGLEVAAAAASSGIRTHVIERQGQLLARSASAEIAGFLQAAHASNGVQFHLGAALRAARAGRDGAGVQLELNTANGPRRVDADLLLAGIGATPNTGLAEAAGLAVANGILVDDDWRTEDPAIFAIGDCAACQRSSESLPVRLESIPAALAQAQGLAAQLCGKPAPDAAAPWFWSDQCGMKIQIAGTRDHDEVLVRRTEDPPSLSLFYVSKGRLAGMESVNNPKGFLQARRLIGLGAPMDAALLS